MVRINHALVPMRPTVVESQVAIRYPERVHIAWLGSLPNRDFVTTAVGHIGIQRGADKLQVLARGFRPA